MNYRGRLEAASGGQVTEVAEMLAAGFLRSRKRAMNESRGNGLTTLGGESGKEGAR